jgi:hypothetical protein
MKTNKCAMMKMTFRWMGQPSLVKTTKSRGICNVGKRSFYVTVSVAGGFVMVVKTFSLSAT